MYRFTRLFGTLCLMRAAAASSWPLLLQPAPYACTRGRCTAPADGFGALPQEFLADRPVSEAVSVKGTQNYEKYSMYKGDKTTHTRTRHGPPELHVLPRTQAQEYGFFTQQQQRFAPANGGPYYPRNASQETKIADALAKDFAKG